MRCHVIEVIEGGTETSVQELPGRVGRLDAGLPPAGPLDPRSFAAANRLVGNPPIRTALEAQLGGPTLRFLVESVVAVTGAEVPLTINGSDAPLWTAIHVCAGDVLSVGFPRRGVRSYLAVAGGFDVPSQLGSRATSVVARCGGYEGRAIAEGDRLKIGRAAVDAIAYVGRSIEPAARTELDGRWEIEVVRGPFDDWLTAADEQQLLSFPWRLSAKSNRVGYRLEGPPFEFSACARDKPRANGDHPSNTIDYGCLPGCMLICGQTPVILMNDAPSLTGYFAPFTVARVALWKLAQACPGAELRFTEISHDDAIARYRAERTW